MNYRGPRCYHWLVWPTQVPGTCGLGSNFGYRQGHCPVLTGYTSRMKAPRTSARDASIGIVAVLRAAGHVAYFSGGCVRDALLELEPKDYDIATDAPPQRVLELFPRSRAVGEAFGVVRVQCAGHWVEVATFRMEWGYYDGRRPGEVQFSDAKHDACRRDFTINGMFSDPDSGGNDRIIDFVGGRADLDAGLIRAIGDPEQRFSEDALRLLRAVRFAAHLDFEIEPHTATSVRANAPSISRISRERIGMEIEAMLIGPRPAKAAIMMRDFGLDEIVFDKPLDEQPCTLLGQLDCAATYANRLDAWVSQRRPTLGVDRLQRSLCLPNAVADDVRALRRLTARAADFLTLKVAARKRLVADRLWDQVVLQWRAGVIEHSYCDSIEWEASHLRGDGIGVNPLPLISGDDLIAMGLAPGPNFRRWLDGVYDAQLEGAVTTRDQAMAWIRCCSGGSD